MGHGINYVHTPRGAVQSLTFYWDVGTLSWVPGTQPTGGGGGGGAVTIADGADVTQGTKADAAWVSGNGTVISLLKKIASAGGSAVSIADGSNVVEGTTTDAAVQGDNSGTISAKLRGLNKSIASGLSVIGVDTTMSAVFNSGNAGPTTLVTAGGGSVVTEVFTSGTPTGAALFVEVLIGGTWYPAEGMAFGPSLTNPIQNFYHISNGQIGPTFFQNGTTNWVTWLATGTQMRFSTTALLSSGAYTIASAFKPGATTQLTGSVLVGNQSNLAVDVTSDNKLQVSVTRPGDGTPVVIINADGQTPAGSAYTPPWGALPYFFNGSTWDRARGDSTNGLFVNVKNSVLPTNAAKETGGNLDSAVSHLSGIHTNTDTVVNTIDAGLSPRLRVNPIVGLNGVSANSGNVDTTTQRVVLATNVALPAGTNILGKVTTDQTTHGTTDLVAADITKVGGSALTLGQKAMAASVPVVIASDQSTLSISAASLPLPTNAAKETGGNLDVINTNTQEAAVALGDIENHTSVFQDSATGGYVRQTPAGTIAKETGGNLDTLASTVASLGSAITPKAITIQGELSGIANPVIISGSVSVSSSALPANAAKETGGHLASIDTKLTSPLEVAGLVSATSELYNDNTNQPLSLTTDGRLRVVTQIDEIPVAWGLPSAFDSEFDATSNGFNLSNQVTIDNVWE